MYIKWKRATKIRILENRKLERDAYHRTRTTSKCAKKSRYPVLFHKIYLVQEGYFFLDDKFVVQMEKKKLKDFFKSFF